MFVCVCAFGLNDKHDLYVVRNIRWFGAQLLPQALAALSPSSRPDRVCVAPALSCPIPCVRTCTRRFSLGALSSLPVLCTNRSTGLVSFIHKSCSVQSTRAGPGRLLGAPQCCFAHPIVRSDRLVRIEPTIDKSGRIDPLLRQCRLPQANLVATQRELCHILLSSAHCIAAATLHFLCTRHRAGNNSFSHTPS